ncbi:hypothetical protein BDV93DRAFT_524928 [Ceratobasidium sp. AG-I]|nr:hypothetical protein BDV93DRAFT_524928 [Ceratobasidium sp. AG-I]
MADYSGAQQELQQLKKNGLTASKLNAAYAAMTERATDAATTEKMVKEIQDLFDSAMAMSKSFEHIKIELGNVDANEYKDKDGKPLEKLQPTWVGFQNRFTHMMWNSRDAATDAATVLTDFVEALCVVLKDPDASFQDKKDALRDFILGSKTTSPSQTQTFTTLHNDVEAFSAKCIAFADTRNAELTAKIKTLNDEITALIKQIEDCDTLVIEMSVLLGGTAVGGIVAGGIIVGALWTTLGAAAPGVLIGLILTAAATMIGALAKLISTLNARSNAQDKYDTKSAELKNLNQQLSDLVALKSNLMTLDREIKQTHTRLDDFSNIRSMPYRDAQAILDYITAASEFDETTLWRVQLMEAVYKALIPGLKKYASRVSESSLPSV